MITPSLTAAGLTICRTVDHFENLRERLRGKAHWGPLVETGPGSRVGNFLMPFAEELGSVSELLEAVYDSQNPDNAEGVQLANVAAITLCRREPATYSRALVTWTGTTSTVIPVGTRVRVPGGPIFALEEETEITPGTTVDAWCTCTVTGEQTAEIGGITQIVDAVTGLTSVTNAAAVDSSTTAGHAIESDEALRYRRERSLALAGSSTDPAIRARLEAYDWITAAVVISNRTDVTVLGQEPHSLAIYLWPAGLDTTLVAAAIFSSYGAPGGIRLVGTSYRIVTDDQGMPTEIRWSYLTELAVHCDVHVTEDTEGESYPADGDDLIKACVVDYGLALAAARDVLPDHIGAWIIGGWTDLDGVSHPGIPGIRALDIRLKVGSAPTVETAPITVAATEIARIALAHVRVFT